MMEPRLYLVNLYDGRVQNSFDDADQLIAYLREKGEAGTLMGEAAFGVFFGKHLSINYFWERAFGGERDREGTN